MPRQIIDLTATIEEGMVQNAPFHPRAPLLWTNQTHNVTQWYQEHLWSGDLPPLFDGLPPEAGQHGQGHGQQSEQVLFGTHMGTHIDAPLHFDGRPEAGDATTIPVEICMGDAILLDLRSEVGDDWGHVITSEDLDAAEARSGDTVRPGDIVILHTGHAAANAYGPNASSASYAPIHPGLGYHAPAWFLERKVVLIGVDTANLDTNQVLTAHVNFQLRPWIGKQPVYIIENLVRLEDISRNRFEFIGLPLPIKDGSGSPIRALAILPD